jgi:acyl dehydratase
MSEFTQQRAQRRLGDVAVGDVLPSVSFPLPVHRLVLAAGGTRDYTAIHHNDEFARSTGAPSMYASAMLLQGMWERMVRDWTGPSGTVRAIRGFRMRQFTLAGSLVRVEGRVSATSRKGEIGVVDLELRSVVDNTITVGPGTVVVTLPA